MEETNKKPNLATPIAVVVAGALIAGAILYGQYRPSVNPPADPNQMSDADIIALAQKEMAPISSADHRRGQTGAKITIVEYSDLECPFCKIFHETMNEFIKTNKITWVFRHFPLESLHSKAITEAIASECAYAQKGDAGFWQFIDEVFTITPSNDGLELTQLPTIATKIGLSVDDFNTCLEGKTTLAKVEADLANATAIGAQGTPFIAIISADNTIYPISNIRDLEQIPDAEVKKVANDLFDLFQAKIAEASK